MHKSHYHSLVYILKKASTETLTTKRGEAGVWSMCADVISDSNLDELFESIIRSELESMTRAHSCQSRMFLCLLLSGLPQVKQSMTEWQPEREAMGKVHRGKSPPRTNPITNPSRITAGNTSSSGNDPIN